MPRKKDVVTLNEILTIASRSNIDYMIHEIANSKKAMIIFNKWFITSIEVDKKTIQQLREMPWDI